MELMFALLAIALAGALVVLPFVSLLRTFVLGRRIEELNKRLLVFEEAARRAQPPAPEAARAQPATAEAATAPPAVPAPVPAPPLLRSREAAKTTPAPKEDLETILGGRWLLYAGLLVLLFGVAFFLKYAFDNAWLDRRARCALGAAAGLALVGGGLKIASRGYDRYGHLLSGAGIVILYLTTYAALELYALVPRPVAGALFMLITAGGAVLADRRASLGLATLAVLGGYATPLLVGGSRDAQLTLFSYIAVLIAGTMYLARRRQWPRLNLVAYGMTVLLVALWADRHYTPAKYLRTELFLTVYCGLFLAILRAVVGSGSRWTAAALASAPLLYYAASLVILWDVRLALFIFLILFSGAALAISVAFGVDALRLAAWAAAALPFAGRIEHTGSAWTPAMLTTLAAIVAMHLAAQVQRLTRGPSLRASDVVLIHANGVFACASAYMILERQWIIGSPWMAWGLAAGFAALAWSIRTINIEAALHWAGLAFGLFAAGTAIRFDGPWVVVTTAAEGAAIAWVALRVRRTWFRVAGLAVVAVSCLQWLALLDTPPPIWWQPALNARALSGAWIIALVYALAWWHRSGGAESRSLFTPLVIGAQLLTLTLLTTEIDAYWRVRAASEASAGLASQLSLSLAWAGYATALVIVGMRRRYAPIRYLAIGLFGITVVKIFLSDLASLGGIYRVVGFLAVGAVLVLVSFLYQRAQRREEMREPAEV
jgi:uncharacterized membrane protein